MEKSFYLVLMIFGMFLGSWGQSALAAENSVTLGCGPIDVNLEYERTLTDSTALSLHIGTAPIVTPYEVYGIEIRNYFNGQSMDGIYAGLGYMHINGDEGKFLVFDIEDRNENLVQLSLGYKKTTESGFTYEAGIIGLNNPSSSESKISGRLAIGYSW
jgi:hypothetical protein